MLPQKRRISTVLFPKIANKGKQVSFGHLTFKYTKDPNSHEGRFSFVVPASVSKKANKRNQIKRRGYSIVQKNNALKKSSITGIFFTKKGVENVPYKQLETEINYILKQVIPTK